MKKAKVHYVDNVKLQEQMTIFIRSFKEAETGGKPKPKIPEYVGKVILDIATRLSMRPNFNRYTYREEMVGDGIENVLTYIHNYDPDKYKNPFAYFTTIIYYAFLRRMDKEKKQTYIKHKLLENNTLLNLLASQSSSDGDEQTVSITLNNDGRLDNLINRFEKKAEKKPKKKKGLDKFEDVGLVTHIDPHPDDMIVPLEEV